MVKAICMQTMCFDQSHIGLECMFNKLNACCDGYCDWCVKIYNLIGLIKDLVLI